MHLRDVSPEMLVKDPSVLLHTKISRAVRATIRNPNRRFVTDGLHRDSLSGRSSRSHYACREIHYYQQSVGKNQRGYGIMGDLRHNTLY